MGSEFDTAKGSQPIVRRPGAKRSPALPQNRQWAEFLRSLATTASEPDPLLPKALKFHPRLHMDIRSEDDRLALLHAQCLRLCCGDHTRAKRLRSRRNMGGPSAGARVG